jgi:hypothetical protein
LAVPNFKNGFLNSVASASVGVLFRVSVAGMHLDCRVSGKEIVITSPGSACVAVYHRIEGEPRLKTKAPPTGPTEFKVQAWRLANDKARELGWIV